VDKSPQPHSSADGNRLEIRYMQSRGQDCFRENRTVDRRLEWALKVDGQYQQARNLEYGNAMSRAESILAWEVAARRRPAEAAEAAPGRIPQYTDEQTR
jgi:hypothetical protein